MSLLDPVALVATLLTTARDVADLGWDQPNLFFAVHGPPLHPQLEYILQLPGGVGDRLQELLELGLRARDDVIGLVLVVGDRACRMASPLGKRRRGRAIVAVLRDGHVVVVVVQDDERHLVVRRLPGVLGDHEEVTDLLMQLLGAGQLPLLAVASRWGVAAGDGRPA